MPKNRAAETATVPFEMLQAGKRISGHLAVQVKINGKGPYRLVFDTGAPDDPAEQPDRQRKPGCIGDKAPPDSLGGFADPGQAQDRKLEIGDR